MVLFVRNPHGEERPCTVVREGKFVLKPLWSSGKFLGAVEEREVKLGSYEIKVWEVIPLLSPKAKISGLNLAQWRRLTELSCA